MSKLYVFSVKDFAVGAFLTPFFSRSKGEALRSFLDACQSSEHQFFKHADDYRLYYLGEFDDETGFFVGLEAPEQLAHAAALLDREMFNAAEKE